MDHVVEARLRNGAGEHGLLEGVGEKLSSPGWSISRPASAAVDGEWVPPPVGEHEALEPPVALETWLRCSVILAGVVRR